MYQVIYCPVNTIHLFNSQSAHHASSSHEVSRRRSMNIEANWYGTIAVVMLCTITTPTREKF